MDELRAVARYAAESAQGVLAIFEADHPRRPAAAGGGRGRLDIRERSRTHQSPANHGPRRTPCRQGGRWRDSAASRSLRRRRRCRRISAPARQGHPGRTHTAGRGNGRAHRRTRGGRRSGSCRPGDRRSEVSSCTRGRRRALSLPQRAARKEPRGATHGRAGHIATWCRPSGNLRPVHPGYSRLQAPLLRRSMVPSPDVRPALRR